MFDPNWFEGHPVFSIISHTIIVAGVTWAASRFIFDEKKLDHYRAIIERKDSEIQALTERLSFVEKENSKYLGWLGADELSFPSLTRKIGELEATSKSIAETGVVDFPSEFPTLIEVKKNQAIVEKATEVIVALHEVSPSRKALLTLTLPGKEPQKFADKVVGDVWRFERDGKKYRMTLMEVSYITSHAKLDLRYDPDAI
jgi:hypothetical protein